MPGECTYVRSPHGALKAGAGGFSFTGLPTTYTPGQKYTFTLTGGTMKGFMIYAKNPTSLVSATNDPRLGTFTVGAKNLLVGGCSGSTLGQSASIGAASISISWTAPAAGSGPVSFFALPCPDINNAYQIQSAAIGEAGTPTSIFQTSAPPTFALPPTSAPPTPPPNSAGNVQGGDTKNANGAGAGNGTLPAGAIIGIAVGAGFLLLCIIANFIPVIASKARGDDPKKAKTLVGSAVRATRSLFNGGNQQQVKMYR